MVLINPDGSYFVALDDDEIGVEDKGTDDTHGWYQDPNGWWKNPDRPGEPFPPEDVFAAARVA